MFFAFFDFHADVASGRLLLRQKCRKPVPISYLQSGPVDAPSVVRLSLVREGVPPMIVPALACWLVLLSSSCTQCLVLSRQYCRLTVDSTESLGCDG